MSDQRISRLTARFEETAREEATTANQGHAQASNPPTEQGRGAALLLELPMIQLDRWLKEKTKKTDGQSRRWSKRRSRLDKEPTKKKLKKKESRKKKSMRRSTITLTPCYQGAEARPIVNKKHHYLKSQPRQKQQQLKPSDQHKALGYPERRTKSE